MKQKTDHYGEKEMAPLSPTDRGNKRETVDNIKLKLYNGNKHYTN